MRRLVLLSLLLLSPFLAPAAGLRDTEVPDSVGITPQDTLRLIQRVDNRLYRSYHDDNVDPDYIVIPERRWRFTTSANGDVNLLQVGHFQDDAGFQMNLHTAPSYSQGFEVAWHGLSLAGGINPAWFFPSLKNADQAYSISLYGNMMGMTASISSSTTLQGQLISLPDSTVTTIPAGNGHDLTAAFDAYYAFNGKRFSMPAVFSRSQIQKQGAGSALLSVSLRSSLSTVAPVEAFLPDTTSVLSHMLSVGGGYGHNFVTPHHWLLHVSYISNLTLLKYNKLREGSREERMKRTFPDFVNIFQAAALHWTDRWFFGAHLTARSSIYGDIRRYEFNNARISASVFIGYRL